MYFITNKTPAHAGVHTGLKMAELGYGIGVMYSREVDRDAGGVDQINTTNKYNLMIINYISAII